MSLADAQAVLDIVFGDEVSDSETIYHGARVGHDFDLMERTEKSVARISGAMYFSASTFGLVKGELVRQGMYSTRMFCVVLDDIGEKYPVPSLPPTLIIETSSGNYQYVYVLEDPLPFAEAQMFLTRMRRAIKAGSLKADKGACIAIQLIKLPIGRNDKDDPAKKGFHTALLPHEGPMYMSSALAAAWTFPDADTVTEGIIIVPGTGVMLDVVDIQDGVLDWLISEGRLMDYGKEDGWFSVRCPLHDIHMATGVAAHTSGDGSAGYSPLGVGSLPNRRVFSCFHESCKAEWDPDSKPGAMSDSFLSWVVDAGGPDLPRIDNAAHLVHQWALIGGREARDMQATGLTQVSTLKLSDFMNMNGQEGDRVGHRMLTMGNLWKAHPGTVRCRGAFYRPDKERLYEAADGQTYMNTYNPIQWPRASVAGSIDVYMAHIERLIPSRSEQDIYHQWIAWKLQNPALRAYALVLVAEAYGTGRSSLGRVLMRLWQSGVRKPGLDKIAGPKHNSQAVFNNWLVDTQLVISEETKQGASSWAQDYDMYETLKALVDTGVTEGVEVSNKYGVDEIATAYCCYLFFTNHADALQIPGKPMDRRFCVLECTTEVLPDAMASAINDFARSPSSLAALYWHYMDMDLAATGFNEHHPPMTDAKQHMIDAGKGSMTQLIEDALEDMPGDIVTQPQLLAAIALLIVEDPALEKRAPGAVGAHFKRMKRIGTRYRYKGNLVRSMIVRNGDRHLAAWNGDNSYLCEILSLNDDRKSNVIRM